MGVLSSSSELSLNLGAQVRRFVLQGEEGWGIHDSLRSALCMNRDKEVAMPKTISLGLLSIAVSFFIYLPSLSAQDKVRIGISAFSPTNGAVWVTEDRAIFKKHRSEEHT